MEENIDPVNEDEHKVEVKTEDIPVSTGQNSPSIIAAAVVLAGVIIAGAILLKSSPGSPVTTTIAPVVTNPAVANIVLAPVSPTDRTLGNPNAKVTLVMYEDFQCPFCGAISGDLPSTAPIIQSLKQQDPTWAPFMPTVMANYVNTGKVQFVYRDFAFLGAAAKASGADPEDESIKSAEAARCAGDQNQFWQYHDYLFSHQNGEDQGAFSTAHLEDFAKTLGLDTTTFNQCLTSDKYAQAVADSKAEGATAGVTGTPKGFILVNGKVVDTIDGAQSLSTVIPKLDAALK